MAQTVLIVEDDPGTRRLFRLTLQSAGLEVKEATDGLDAIGVLQMESVDLILTDLEMPKIDGISAIDTYISMRNARDVPIIVATGSADPGMIQRAKDAGAVAVLRKPLSPDQLIAAVNAQLGASNGN